MRQIAGNIFASMAGARPPTPPHLPTYKVHLSEQRIQVIINTLFPQSKVIKIKQLESGKSYNNRIYFIDIEESIEPSTEQSNATTSLILKLAGHFFDYRKIENELGCLLLLRKHCPDLPVPEPFAWSANGATIETVGGVKIEAGGSERFSDHAWILMSKLEGKVLTCADLDSKYGNGLLKQLAGYLTMWRTRVPQSPVWGNLAFQPDRKLEESGKTFTDLMNDKTFLIDGYLFNNFYWPNTSLFYSTLARDKLSQMRRESHFGRTKSAHADEWEEWADKELPRYPLCQGRSCVLTHLDFSPRNILTAHRDGVLMVSGIIDIEFMSFAPPEEEFLNAMVRQEGDWEDRHWQIILREMSKLGQQVPPTPGVSKEQCYNDIEWKQARIIAKTIDRIAPWEIVEGKFEEEELNRELDEAAGVVNEGIRRLRELGNVRT